MTHEEEEGYTPREGRESSDLWEQQPWARVRGQEDVGCPGGKIKVSDMGPTEQRLQRRSWCGGRKGSGGLFGCE